MNKIKYNLQEFIENENLVIICHDIKQLRIAGSYLWPEMLNKLETWNPFHAEFPLIAWYAEKNNNFNLLSNKYVRQTAIEFEDVIFKKFPKKWVVKFGNRENFEEINKHFNNIWTYDNDDRHSEAFVDFMGRYYVKGERIIENYTEITFEEFEEHVLGKKQEEEDLTYLIDFLKKLNIKQ